MRMLFTGFDQTVAFRFIKFQLGRNSWRNYKGFFAAGQDDGNKV